MTKYRARRYFLEQLVKYETVDFYWIEDRLVSRSVHVSIRWPIPRGAEFVGRYAYPFPPDRFLADLNDALARIDTSRSIEAGASPALA